MTSSVPVSHPDLDWIAMAAMGWLKSRRWELHGRTPSPDSIVRNLWDRVPFVVAVHDDGPIGLVQVHDEDLQSSHAELGLLVRPDRVEEVAAEFERILDRIFDTFPFRKLYLYVASTELPEMRPLLRSASLEGQLIEHLRVSADHRADLLICAYLRGDGTVPVGSVP